MEAQVAHTNNSVSMHLPKAKKTNEAVSNIPEGYMSLEQFEKELVEAVVKKL